MEKFEVSQLSCKPIFFDVLRVLKDKSNHVNNSVKKLIH